MQDLFNAGFVPELINAVQAGVIVCNPEGNILHLNEQATSLLQLESGKLWDRTDKGTDWQFFYPDGSEMPQDDLPVNRVNKQLQALQITAGIRPECTGITVWVSLTAKPVFNSTGNLNYIVVTLQKADEHRHAQSDVSTDFFPDLAENIQGENSLCASRNYYQAIFENTGTGVLIIEEDRTIKMVNRQFENYTGYSKEEIEDKMSWMNFVHPDDVDFMLQEHRLRRKNPEMAHKVYEFRLLNRYNECINVYLNIDTIPGTRRSLASLIDITELKDVEEKLRKSRRELEQIVEGTPVAMFVIDANHIITHWNNACERLTGLSASKMVGSSDAWRGFYREKRPVMADLVVDEALEKDMDTYYGNRYKKSSIFEETYVVENFFSNLGEEGKWLYFTASPLRDEKGNISGAIETLLDVTERKKAEEELRESEGRLRVIFDSIPDIILLKDTAGRYTHCNAAMEKLFETSQSEIIGKSESDLFQDADVREIREADARVCEKGEIVRDTYTRHIGEKEIVFDTIKAPVKNVQDDVVGICAISRDITEQTKLRKERRKIQEQYQHSQKIQAIGRLAGGVAHDLNNLLTPMLNYSEMLMQECDADDSRKQRVENIYRASLRARDLVGQLLAFSRKQTLETRVLDINWVIRNLEDLLRKTIREDIYINLKLDSELPKVKVDEGQVEQVLINMALNAQDAMPDGGKIILETGTAFLPDDYVQKYHEVSPGYYLRMTVSDTGQGMGEDTKEKIFDPFFTTKEKDKGTGLGLATVYGIVKQHGGHITVYSEPGQGSTFNIYLPVSEEEEQEVRESVLAAEYNSGGEAVMVVEDNDMVRELTETILAEQGYTVYSAINGKNCLEQLQDISPGPDLLLTDVVMPDMNGKELFQQVADFFPQIKVLYMSGYTEEAIVNQGVLDKNVNYIQKPFSIATMTQKIREVLDG